MNQAAWDEMRYDSRFAGEMSLPGTRDEALAGIDPWLADDFYCGARLLCLGAGGGRQGPLHAIAGADVTVVDISAKQLAHDAAVAKKLDIKIKLIQASADRLLGIDDASFDIVIQPVSACYVKNLQAMYKEVYRVLRPGGSYLVQHKQPNSLHAKCGTDGKIHLTEKMVTGKGLAPTIGANFSTRERGTVEFAHSLEALLGGLCESGFSITRFSEPPRADAFALIGSAEYLACFVTPYLRIKAIRG